MSVLIYNNYGIKNWDAHFTVPTFDFFFKLNIPKANKERLILERDLLGRIVSSKAPEIYLSNTSTIN